MDLCLSTRREVSQGVLEGTQAGQGDSRCLTWSAACVERASSRTRTEVGSWPAETGALRDDRYVSAGPDHAMDTYLIVPYTFLSRRFPASTEGLDRGCIINSSGEPRTMSTRKNIFRMCFAAALAAGLTACGGGGKKPNTAPSLTLGGTATITEGTIGSTGLKVTATDDQGDDITVQVSDARFEVDADGNLTVVAGTVLDYEMESSIAVDITASDGALEDKKTATVSRRKRRRHRSDADRPSHPGQNRRGKDRRHRSDLHGGRQRRDDGQLDAHRQRRGLQRRLPRRRQVRAASRQGAGLRGPG